MRAVTFNTEYHVYCDEIKSRYNLTDELFSPVKSLIYQLFDLFNFCNFHKDKEEVKKALPIPRSLLWWLILKNVLNCLIVAEISNISVNWFARWPSALCLHYNQEYTVWHHDGFEEARGYPKWKTATPIARVRK